jgi:hypothetical protein
MKSSAGHRQALSSFEEVDPNILGLQSKIANFQKKQKEQSKRNDDYFEWIKTGVKLNDSEAALSKQTLQACSNVLELMGMEKDYEERQLLCDNDDLRSRNEAFQSLQDDMAVLKKSAIEYSCKDEAIRDGIARVRRVIDDGAADEQECAVCAKILLDLKESLFVEIGELDQQYAVLSHEAGECRQKVMVSYCDSQNNDDDQNVLPLSLVRALDSLRSLSQENDSCDDGKVDSLENEIRKKFEDARIEQNCIALNVEKTASSSCDEEIILLAKKTSLQKLESLEALTKTIEKDALEDIECLREDINARFQATKSFITTNLKRKEMTLRLKAMRLERESLQKIEAERRTQAEAKDARDAHRKEMQQTIRVLESKDALLKHQAHQLDVQKENSMHIKHDLAEEIKSQSQQLKNKNRSLFRQSQIERRIATKKVADEKAALEEESRIARLNELATRVPYYDSIMEKLADIHKSTEARKHDVYARPKLPDFQSNNLKSFTNEKVFSNPNFR